MGECQFIAAAHSTIFNKNRGVPGTLLGLASITDLPVFLLRFEGYVNVNKEAMGQVGQIILRGGTSW